MMARKARPMNKIARVLLAFTVASAAPVALHAHFRLLEPASWIVENERGDPQKAAPCGGLTSPADSLLLCGCAFFLRPVRWAVKPAPRNWSVYWNGR